MTDTPPIDVLIGGGSYAGLALALALSHQSGGELSVTVAAPDFPSLDPSAGPVRATALSRASLAFLRHVDLWEQLSPFAQPVASIELTDSDLGDVIRPPRLTYDLALSEAALPRMVILENRHLGAALHHAARAAPGVTLREGTAIAAFSSSPTNAVAVPGDGSKLTARLLVAADGGRSVIRAAANIPVHERPYDQSGIITIVELAHPHHGRAIQHFLPAGPFAVLPMTGNRICITWSESALEAKRITSLDAKAFRREIEVRLGHDFGPLQSLSPPQSWPLTFAVARTLISNRLALIGDAAHTVHPIAGQGLNLALRDVAALSDCIVDTARLGLDIGAMDTLQRYERWRRFDNLASATGFDALNRLFSLSSTLARSARTAALGIVDQLPGLKSLLIDEASGAIGDRPRLLR